MKTFAKSNLVALLVSCASDNDCVAFDDAKFCASNGFCHLSDYYCSSATCGEKDGDCDGHSQCEGDLVCADDVFLLFHPLVTTTSPDYRNVCTQKCKVDNDCPENTFCTLNKACIPFEDYCSSPNLCGRYEGDCDNDSQCIGDLVCGSNNFRSRHPNVTTNFDNKDACEMSGMDTKQS